MRRPGRLGEVITLQRALEITNRSPEAQHQAAIWADREMAHLRSSAGAANVLGLGERMETTPLTALVVAAVLLLIGWKSTEE